MTFHELDRRVRRLEGPGVPVVSDEQVDREIDEMIAGILKLDGEARRLRFDEILAELDAEG